MPDYSHLLGDSCRRARTALGMTQDELAIRCGIDSRTILNIENYRGNPSLACLAKLFEVLHIDSNEIFSTDSDRDSIERMQLHYMISDCNETEVRTLLKICDAILSVLRSPNYCDVKKQNT